MLTQPHLLAELDHQYGLTSTDIAWSIGTTNARILGKLKGYAVQQKFIDYPEWQTKTTYYKAPNTKKSMHVVLMSMFAAKVVLLSIRSSKAQDYLVFIFLWETYYKTNKQGTSNTLKSFPDWKEDFVN